MGLSGDVTAPLLNWLFAYIEEGKVIKEGHGVRCDFGLGEKRLEARAVPRDRYYDYLGWACWFYRSLLFKVEPLMQPKFPILQLCWPDKAGRYP